MTQFGILTYLIAIVLHLYIGIATRAEVSLFQEFRYLPDSGTSEIRG